jgi:uncharacterized protein with HEPN domain
MYDQTLALDVLRQIESALRKVQERSSRVASAAALTATPEGEERLDGLCMLFIAIGESLKNLDKITSGTLLSAYPQIDWKGAMGFRDVIAHRYFDIDAEQVWWICTHEVVPLTVAIGAMIDDLEA